MIAKLLPFLLLVVGVAAGAGAGFILSPSAAKDAPKAEKEAKPKPEKDSKKKTKDGKASSAHEYFKLSKQFVVPVVDQDEISALVTMSLSLETRPGIAEEIYEIEPKLRDGFLQVMFDHANTGGFDGVFTTSDNLESLRQALLEQAQKEMGSDVSRVLIMNVSRQDT